MKISLNWLKEFVDISDSPETIGRNLTSVGFAMDAIESTSDDTIYEFDITTNRPDCLSHLGIAREVSAIYGSALRKPTFSLVEGSEETTDAISIEIADPELCGRYSGRYIEGVKIGPSPEWLRRKLEGLGLRSINNVADVTNYVMMEIGQPLHAFDADTLRRQQIIVRRAEIDEKITTLDGQERTLNPLFLVIADAERPVAIAGVMGGTETEISAATRNVMLESAYFFPTGIRKTARTLGMSTEASYRYERGADIDIAGYACDRAAALIQQVAGGTVRRGLIDVYPAANTPVRIGLRKSRIAAFLGAPVPDEIVERILQRLELHPEVNDDGWITNVPSFRVDLENEVDLLEEIARHYGFDKFPATLPPFSGYGSGLPHERQERELRNLLAAFGYSETYGLSFSSEAVESAFRPKQEPVRLRNPMSEEWTILRTSLVSSILTATEWNIHRGRKDLQLYELGKVYRAGSENRSLILVATGNLRSKSVHEAQREFDFFDLKGHVEGILQLFRLPGELSRSDVPGYYHPGRAARFGSLAVFGELHPDYAQSIKTRQRLYIAELEVDEILKSAVARTVEPLPRYPSVRRDLSLLFEKSVDYASIRDIIQNVAIPELIRVEPFDRLDSGPFPESKYSLSISLLYQSSERTLTDGEVDSFDHKIIERLEQHLAAQLRK